MNNFQLGSRQAALQVLNNFNAAEHNSAELIDKFGGKTENRASLVDITLGVIRNSIFIDSFISQISGQPLKNIPRKILNCFRIAVYEMIFTGQAQYAVVDEVVELAKKIGSKKAAGFVNAVLRKVCASIKNQSAELNKSDSRKIMPLTPEIGCEFNIDILPDENKHQAEYLSRAFSLPFWLVEQFLNQYGYQQTKNICFASNRRPSVYARPNKLKTTPEKLLNILKLNDIDCVLDEEYKMVKLNRPGNIAEFESFKAGFFTIQDKTASLVVPLLNPQVGWKVFDICAAPGTKTTHIAELMGDKGLIIATDKDNSRLRRIDENIQRLGITSVKVLSYDNFLKEKNADAVLVDVPCSNTGVLAKRPEVRLRLNKKQMEELAKIQRQLLANACALVTKGGRVCYSTCSILKQENSDVVNNFISQNKKFTLEREKFSLPSIGIYDCDGGYAAIITKS